LLEKGIFLYLQKNILMKRGDFDFISSINGAFDILLSKETIDVHKLNEVLFYCMNPFVHGNLYLAQYKCKSDSVVEYLNNCYESIYEGFPIEKQQKKICKMTIDLLNVLEKCGCKDLTGVSMKREKWNWIRYNSHKRIGTYVAFL
jgi:hypothetical protein